MGPVSVFILGMCTIFTFQRSCSLAEDLEEFLLQKTAQVQPRDAYVKGAMRSMDGVFKLLKSSSTYNLDRSYIDGSNGRGTALMFADFDFVIFIEGLQSPAEFENVIDTFYNTINTAALPGVQEVVRCKSIVWMRIYGIEVELVPAISMVPNYLCGHQPLINVTASTQASAVLEKMKSEPESGYLYSGSLCETALVFAGQQTEFVASVARLAKLWNRLLYTETKIGARSYIVELIAIHEAKNSERAGCASLDKTFSNFLKAMANIDKAAISFDDFNPITDAVGPRTTIENSKLKLKKPFLIEPRNPYRNLLDGFPVDATKVFREYAQQTLQKISGPAATSIFQVGASIIPKPKELNGKTIHWTVGDSKIFVENAPTLNIGKNKAFYGDYNKTPVNIFLQAVLYFLQTAIITSTSVDELVITMDKFLLDNFGSPMLPQNATTMNPDHFDAIIVIPLYSITAKTEYKFVGITMT